MTGDEILARVLYRDALMLVIDKPAGLPVHPGPKGGETLVQHLDALRFGLPRQGHVGLPRTGPPRPGAGTARRAVRRQ